MEQPKRNIREATRKLDNGFIGSTLDLWIKHAHAERFFMLNLIFLIERSIAVKYVFINTMEGKVGLNIKSLRKTQLLLKKVKNHGTKGLILTKELATGKVIMLGMTLCMIGYKLNLVNQNIVSYVKELTKKYIIGPTKATSIRETYQIGNVCV